MQKIHLLTLIFAICPIFSSIPAELSPSKRIRAQEQDAPIAKNIEIPTLNDLCLAKAYLSLLPKIVEAFDIQLNLISGFDQLPLAEQTKIIQGLCYKFANLHITLDELCIGSSDYSSQSAALQPFFKKIMRYLLAKNNFFRDWISRYKNVLLESTPETIDEKLKLFAALPFCLQEHIQEQLVFSQILEPTLTQVNTSRTCIIAQSVETRYNQELPDNFALDENYITLSDFRRPRTNITIVNKDLDFIIDLPRQDEFYEWYLVHNVCYFGNGNRVCAYDLTEKKYTYLTDGIDPIVYTYLAQNNLLFTVTKLPNRKYGILCWDLKTGKPIHKIIDIKHSIFPFLFEDNQLYAIDGDNCEILRIDLTTKNVERFFAIRDTYINDQIDNIIDKCIYDQRDNKSFSGFIFNNILYVKIYNSLLILQLPSAQELSCKEIASISELYSVQRKNHLLYILSGTKFCVWDMNQKKFLDTVNFSEYTTNTACNSDQDFIYLMDRTNNRTMILDRHTYARVCTVNHPSIPNRRYKYIAYADKIFAAAIYENNETTKKLDCRVYIIDPITEENVWVLDDHESKVIDIKSNNDDSCFYTSDQGGTVIKWKIPIRYWKSVLYQKMLTAAKTIEDLEKLQIRLHETYFIRQLSDQEGEEIAAEIDIRKKELLKTVPEDK